MTATEAHGLLEHLEAGGKLGLTEALRLRGYLKRRATLSRREAVAAIARELVADGMRPGKAREAAMRVYYAALKARGAA